MQYDIKCPNCGETVEFNLDEWGYTPFHLHCRKCSINIGANSIDKCISLFNDYHKKNTTLEYYKGGIQLLFEERKIIINKEQEI